MDQSKWSIPRERTDRLSKTFQTFDRPRAKCHAIWAHFEEIAFFIADPRVSADSSFVIECSCRALERIMQRCRAANREPPKELIIWSDNCVRESKNSPLMLYLCVLVLKNKFRFTSIQMSQVGHTHNTLDRVFGQLTIAFRYMSTLTDIDDICTSL